jgi:hypothetical protein
MRLAPGGRKLGLTLHVVVSVGWLGAVAAFLALAVTALTGADAATVRSACGAMGVIAWTVIVPLAAASFASGVVQALGTPWGVLRHYWVLGKLLLTAVALAAFAMHLGPITSLATAAQDAAVAPRELGAVRLQVAVDASAAVVLLLVTTVLSIYKPAGLTARGQRS